MTSDTRSATRRSEAAALADEIESVGNGLTMVGYSLEGARELTEADDALILEALRFFALSQSAPKFFCYSGFIGEGRCATQCKACADKDTRPSTAPIKGARYWSALPSYTFDDWYNLNEMPTNPRDIARFAWASALESAPSAIERSDDVENLLRDLYLGFGNCIADKEVSLIAEYWHARLEPFVLGRRRIASAIEEKKDV